MFWKKHLLKTLHLALQKNKTKTMIQKIFIVGKKYMTIRQKKTKTKTITIRNFYWKEKIISITTFSRE